MKLTMVLIWATLAGFGCWCSGVLAPESLLISSSVAPAAESATVVSKCSSEQDALELLQLIQTREKKKDFLLSKPYWDCRHQKYTECWMLFTVLLTKAVYRIDNIIVVISCKNPKIKHYTKKFFFDVNNKLKVKIMSNRR